jgi:hypothetical protein
LSRWMSPEKWLKVVTSRYNLIRSEPRYSRIHEI